MEDKNRIRIGRVGAIKQDKNRDKNNLVGLVGTNDKFGEELIRQRVEIIPVKLALAP